MHIDTGAVAFGDDWPGLFLRGDDALYYGFLLHHLVDALAKVIDVDTTDDPHLLQALVSLPNLVKKLHSVDVRDPLHKHVQLRGAHECLASPPTLRGPGPEESPDGEIEIG